MSFYKIMKKWQGQNLKKYFNDVSSQEVKKIIAKDKINSEDFLKLLSTEAANHLETMARKAHNLTVQNFGKVVLLYAPLYLGNYCQNQCVYCSFNSDNNFERKKLEINEVRREAEVLLEKGIKHILILTGSSRKHTQVSYIKKCVEVLKEYFSSISIEVYPMQTSEYEELIEAGVSGLTLYQEVYNKEVYDKLHLKGPKTDYKFRLDGPERGCKAGMRNVNIGPLFGLDNWRKEAFWLGMHAQYLQNKYLSTAFNVSLPRLQPSAGNFRPRSEVDDKSLVQIMLAIRLFLPRIGINISTRENAEIRNNLIPLGVTKFSAESNTVVGGYTSQNGESQFSISDDRSIDKIKKMMKDKGYQAIFKDWHIF